MYAGIAASVYDKFLMVAVLALVSGLFFLSDDHRFGVVFLREGVIALSLLAVAYILMAKKHELDAADWYLLVMVGLLFLIPPIFAYFNFHQPLYYGFLEERRTLLYLFYFLVMLVIGSKKGYGDADLETILKYLFYAGLVWSVANAFEWIPRHSGFSFSVHAEQFDKDYVATDARFATRFMEAGFLLALYPYYLVARGNFLKAALPVLLLLAYMLYINQTRSFGLLIALTIAWIMILRLRDEQLNISLLIMIPLLSVLAYFSYFLYAHAFNDQVLFYDYHRNRELQIMLGETLNDFFMPHGGLSLQFNEGFLSVYGLNLYVSDIGLTGLLFKYGILFFPLSFLMIMVVYLLSVKYKNDFSIILMASLIADFMLVPFGDVLGRGTEEFAILMILIRIQGVSYEHKYIACVRRGWAS
jgi:hypothetical protein